MAHFLETERIFFREVSETDINTYGNDYYKWMQDQEVNQYMETRFRCQSKDDILNYIKKMSNDSTQFFFAICLNKINIPSHIGNIKLGPVNWFHRNADISLFIGRKDLWGKGYGTEAIKLITEFAFKVLNMHKVKAGIYAGNTGSLRSFDKNGFKNVGCLRDDRFLCGGYTNLYIMEKINE